jgi:hypothetical protein
VPAPYAPSKLASPRRRRRHIRPGWCRGWSSAELLVAMSPATIDRRLANAKVVAGFTGRSHTKPGSLLKSQIPI